MKFYSEELEMSAIGAIVMLGDSALVEGIVSPQMFHNVGCRLIAECIWFLSEVGREIDLVTIKHELIDRGKLDECGGIDFLVEACEFVPSPAHVETYCLGVRDLWRMREARQRVTKWLKDSDEVARENVESAIERLYGCLEFSVGVEQGDWQEFHQIETEGKEMRGYTTGFEQIDKLSEYGGFPSGQVSVVSAYHKGGKTTMMTTMFSKQIDAGLNAVYVSFADMNALRLKRRIMRIRTGWGDMPTESLFLMEKWQQEYEELCERRPRILDATRKPHLRTVEGICRALKAQHKKRRIDVAYLDYFQRIETVDPKAGNDYAAHKIVSRKLANFAEETGIPIVVGSQVTPGGKDRETITKGGRDLEEDAAWVWRLSREADSDDIELEIAASRFGPQNVKIDLRFDKERLSICCP